MWDAAEKRITNGLEEPFANHAPWTIMKCGDADGFAKPLQECGGVNILLVNTQAWCSPTYTTRELAATTYTPP
jgi:hypothetical protein